MNGMPVLAVQTPTHNVKPDIATKLSVNRGEPGVNFQQEDHEATNCSCGQGTACKAKAPPTGLPHLRTLGVVKTLPKRSLLSASGQKPCPSIRKSFAQFQDMLLRKPRRNPHLMTLPELGRSLCKPSRMARACVSFSGSLEQRPSKLRPVFWTVPDLNGSGLGLREELEDRLPV